jgi:RND superfamily putative drug exporter
MKFLAEKTYRFRWLVISIWIVSLVGITAVTGSIGAAFSSSFELPNTESSQVQEVLLEEFPAQGGDMSQIVFEATGKLTSPENQETIEKLMNEVGNSPIVESIDSPFEPTSVALNSDQNIGFATIHFNGAARDLPKEEIKNIVDISVFNIIEINLASVNLSRIGFSQSIQLNYY